MCFEVVPIEGRGFAAVATRDLALGEIILAETPVLSCRTDEPGEAWREMLYAEFERLTPEAQAEVMALHDTLITKPEKSVEGILFTNAIGRQLAKFDMALLLKVSRFNHSCSPNVEQSWDEDAGQAHLIAAEPISAGEELFTHYVELREPRKERQQKLLEGYGFVCDCRACRTSDVETSDRRRVRLKRLDEDIRKKGPKDVVTGLKMVNKALELYDKEGLHMSGFRKWHCRSAAEFSLRIGELFQSSRWARKAADYSRLAHGPQHRDTKFLVEFSKDPSSQMESRTDFIRNASVYVILFAAIGVIYTLWQVLQASFPRTMAMLGL